MARISRHVVRLEREYKLAERLKREDDPECKHFVDPLLFKRLPARLTGEYTLVAFIVRAPGTNYLRELVEFGPNFYKSSVTSPPTSPTSPTSLPIDSNEYKSRPSHGFEKIPMHMFLDFAIGAAESCEILHHGKGLVHGEVSLVP